MITIKIMSLVDYFWRSRDVINIVIFKKLLFFKIDSLNINIACSTSFIVAGAPSSPELF